MYNDALLSRCMEVTAHIGGHSYSDCLRLLQLLQLHSLSLELLQINLIWCHKMHLVKSTSANLNFSPTVLTASNGSRLYCSVASVCRLSVVCNVCIVAKRCALPKNYPKKQKRNCLWRVKWSRDRLRHVTLKGQTRDPNTLRDQYLENSWRCYL